MGGGIMVQGQMMGDVMGMSNQMSKTMRKMLGVMKDIPAGNKKMISVVKKDLSQQMMGMHQAMGKGKVSAKEIQKMQSRMTEIRKNVNNRNSQITGGTRAMHRRDSEERLLPE
jgi:hypothetical protein